MGIFDRRLRAAAYLTHARKWLWDADPSRLARVEKGLLTPFAPDPEGSADDRGGSHHDRRDGSPQPHPQYAPRGPADWQTTRAKVAVTRLPSNANRLLVGGAAFVVLAIFVSVVRVAWRWYSQEETINGSVAYPHASLTELLMLTRRPVG
jgi:hypothetical protein